MDVRAETLWITWRDIAKHWTEEMESETGIQCRGMDKGSHADNGQRGMPLRRDNGRKKLGILFRIMDDVLNQNTIS